MEQILKGKQTFHLKKKKSSSKPFLLISKEITSELNFAFPIRAITSVTGESAADKGFESAVSMGFCAQVRVYVCTQTCVQTSVYSTRTRH